MPKSDWDSMNVQCCFCGQPITAALNDPVILTIELEDDALQQLPCHEGCLRKVLHPSVPLGLV
jgi:hypothetical protein